MANEGVFGGEYRWWHTGVSLLIPLSRPRLQEWLSPWTREKSVEPLCSWLQLYFRLVPKWSYARQKGRIGWYEFIVDRFEAPSSKRVWWLPRLVWA